MAKIEVTQIKSSIGYNKNQSAILESLGLRKISDKITHDDTPQIRGMINKVSHLVNVMEV